MLYIMYLYSFIFNSKFKKIFVVYFTDTVSACTLQRFWLSYMTFFQTNLIQSEKNMIHMTVLPLVREFYALRETRKLCVKCVVKMSLCVIFLLHDTCMYYWLFWNTFLLNILKQTSRLINFNIILEHKLLTFAAVSTIIVIHVPYLPMSTIVCKVWPSCKI